MFSEMRALIFFQGLLKALFLLCAQKVIDRHGQIKIELYLNFYFTQLRSLTAYLHDFPVDVIKVDRTFISGTDQKPVQEIAQLEIVQTVIDLAHNLGVSVVAEGIETESQRLRLLELGYKFGQGYYFSQPVDYKIATAMLADRQP